MGPGRVHAPVVAVGWDRDGKVGGEPPGDDDSSVEPGQAPLDRRGSDGQVLPWRWYGDRRQILRPGDELERAGDPGRVEENATRIDRVQRDDLRTGRAAVRRQVP